MDETSPPSAVLRGSVPLFDSDYPAAARRQGQQGIVRIIVSDSPQGRSDGCAVVRSSGSAELDAAACRVARRTRFLPALTADARPTAGRIGLEFAWVLPTPE